MTKAEQAKANVIELLFSAGFIPDGDTRSAASSSSDYMRNTADKQSKEWAAASGRLRFVKFGTSIKATVGARTTALYRVEGKGILGVKGIASLNTSDVGAIRTVLEGLK